MTLTQQDYSGKVLANGRYLIRESLDKGSMGFVYLAFDKNLETDVVIKIPKATKIEDHGFRKRFEQESRFLVKLSHPHVVKILDVGVDDGLPFFVMQFVDGGSLKSRLHNKEGKRIRPELSSLKDWLVDVAKALDFMHQQGCIHRDVKPANILFDKHGNAYLSDFGLSKIRGSNFAEELEDNKSDMTAAGAVVGTPSYVAPEIVLGKEYDGKADQYSLATTVYDALVGKSPLEGPTASATMVNQTNKFAPLLNTVLPYVSQKTAKIMHKAMGKDPSKRFKTCEQFATALMKSLVDVSAENNASSFAANQEISVSEATVSNSTKSSQVQDKKKKSVITRYTIKKVSTGQNGKIPCPECGAMLVLPKQVAGKKALCSVCDSKLIVSPAMNELGLLVLNPKANHSEHSTVGSEFDTVLKKEVFGLSLSDKQMTYLVAGLVTSILLVAVYFTYSFTVDTKQQLPMKINSEGGPSAAKNPGKTPRAAKPISTTIFVHPEYLDWISDGVNTFINIYNSKSGGRSKSSIKNVKFSDAAVFESLQSGGNVSFWIPSSKQSVDSLRFGAAEKPTADLIREGDISFSPIVCLLRKKRCDDLLGKDIKDVPITKLTQAAIESVEVSAANSRFRLGMPRMDGTGGAYLPWLSLAYGFKTIKSAPLGSFDVENPYWLDYTSKLDSILIHPKSPGDDSFQSLVNLILISKKDLLDAVVIPEHLALLNKKQIEDVWGEPAKIIAVTPHSQLDCQILANKSKVSDSETQLIDQLINNFQSTKFQQHIVDMAWRPSSSSIKIDEPSSPFHNYELATFFTGKKPITLPEADVIEKMIKAYQKGQVDQKKQ